MSGSSELSILIFGWVLACAGSGVNTVTGDIEDNLTKHNSKEAYKVVKDLTTDRKSNGSTIQDKRGN